MGEIVGRFFGPNADELGGAVNASRDVTGTDDDRSLYGYIAVRQLAPSKTLGSAGLLAGNRRDFTAMTTELQEDDGMATVERIANGWRVSVGGRTVELRDDLDYGSAPQFSTIATSAPSATSATGLHISGDRRTVTGETLNSVISMSRVGALSERDLSRGLPLQHL